MGKLKPDVVICGAGIAGVSTAYHLAVNFGVPQVLLVDEAAPLSLTSDKSTECYRNWWPGPDDAMVRMMNRSIDILEGLAETSRNVFRLNRRGYVFATAKTEQAKNFSRAGERAAHLGAGPLRVFTSLREGRNYQPAPPEGYHGQPEGADLILGSDLLGQYFPYLSSETIAAIHIRRAGWLSAQQLGAYMLQQARKAGVEVTQDRVAAVEMTGGAVSGVILDRQGLIPTPVFINAAGPFLKPVGEMLDVNLPVDSELHLKLSFRDQLGILPRQAPLLIWSDPQQLPWSDEDRLALAEVESDRWLLESFPSGVHTRPEGGEDSKIILLLWEYNAHTEKPVFPIRLDAHYPEIVLRGISTMIPGLESYLDRLPKPILDGGYYTKTVENRPLACPLPFPGAYVIGALSGFGIMSAPALGELLASHVAGSKLPAYAAAFDLQRYNDPVYQQSLSSWGDSWQL
jgi:glycine/D-amino acid oxidase-like deaminating enzyme